MACTPCYNKQGIGKLEAGIKNFEKFDKSSKETTDLEELLKKERNSYLHTIAILKEELHATKADNWKLQGELLETVQKKIELFEEVEQWQLDMEVMVHSHLKCVILLEQMKCGKPSIQIPLSGTTLSIEDDSRH